MFRCATRASSRTLLGAITIASLAGPALAVPITFLHTSHGAGTINGIAFPDSPFTITAIADTDDRQSFTGGYSITHSAATIDIVGVGTYTILTPTRTFVSNTGSTAGFSRSGPIGTDLVTSGDDPSLSAWDMESSIGPVPGPGRLLQWGLLPKVNTSGGILFFPLTADPGGTFQAILVPAPASLGVLLAGGLVVARRRR